MHLAQDENVLKIFYHHPLPLALRIIGIWTVSLPFFLVASFFQGLLSGSQMWLLYGGIAIIFVLITIYAIALYFLDRIIITNMRIVHVDWKGLFLNEEVETDLSDIQDINIKEPGLLTAFGLFNFGTFNLATAASKVTIVFKYATNPEGIKNFIYQLQRKPAKIGSYDQAITESQKKSAITGVK